MCCCAALFTHAASSESGAHVPPCMRCHSGNAANKKAELICTSMQQVLPVQRLPEYLHVRLRLHLRACSGLGIGCHLSPTDYIYARAMHRVHA